MATVKTPEYMEIPIVREEESVVMAEMPELVLSVSAVGTASESASAPKPSIADFGPLSGDITPEVEGADKKQTSALVEPQVRFGKLANGVRVVGIDRHGLCSSVGLFVHAGSRYETAENAYLPHVLELNAFRSTAHLSQIRTLKTLEQLGAAATCRVGREDILYQVDVLREYVPVVLPLMLANVLCPSLLPDEVLASHDHVMDVQMNLEENPESLISELLHVAAYKDNTLGNKLYAEEQDLAKITPENIKNFIDRRCSPDKQILVGVNVDFDELCKWAARCYAEHAGPAPSSASQDDMLPAEYTGGDLRLPNPTNPLCHLMFGWEVAQGWNGPNLAAVTVLQMFLGGGGSFSTGGPGKGMHTRLYTEVLNRHPWVESCQASSVMYADSGIFTIYATVLPQRADEFVKVLHQIFQSLKRISPVEMQRAKNALKSSIHMNLEMRSVMMEDIGRQLVLASKVGTAKEFGAMIDAVTPNDLVEVLRRCLKTNPTVVAFGAVEKVPPYEKIVQRFSAGIP